MYVLSQRSHFKPSPECILLNLLLSICSVLTSAFFLLNCQATGTGPGPRPGPGIGDGDGKWEWENGNGKIEMEMGKWEIESTLVPSPRR